MSMRLAYTDTYMNRHNRYTDTSTHSIYGKINKHNQLCTKESFNVVQCVHTKDKRTLLYF